MRIKILPVLLLISLCSHAGTVDTISIPSSAMKRSFNCVVIKPDSYKKKKLSFPSVYLLHGVGGDFRNWINRVPELKTYADLYQLIIICPDGNNDSWYMDSPLDSNHKFETYVGTELPAYIEAHYRVIHQRSKRAITGLSMGGHGGLYLGFRHADFFGACGSMSGAIEIEKLVNRYGLQKILGDTTNKQRYFSHSIFAEAEKPVKDTMAIILDCGLSDPFIEMNRKLHQKLMQAKLPHDYIERPGNHSWPYWINSIQYHLLFFRKYFDRSNQINARYR